MQSRSKQKSKKGNEQSQLRAQDEAFDTVANASLVGGRVLVSATELSRCAAGLVYEAPSNERSCLVSHTKNDCMDDVDGQAEQRQPHGAHLQCCGRHECSVRDEVSWRRRFEPAAFVWALHLLTGFRVVGHHHAYRESPDEAPKP